MNVAWVRAQDRKRTSLAAASTVCIYALAFLCLWLISSLEPASLASTPGTVLVDLGGSGPPGDVPQGLENAPDRPAGAKPGAAPAPAAQAAAQAVAPKAVPPKAAPAKARASPASTSLPSAKSIPQPAPQPGPKAASSANAIPEAQARVSPPQQPAAQSAAAAQSAPQAAQAAPALTPEQEASIRAAEAAAAEPPPPPQTRTFGSASKPGAASGVASGGSATGAPVASGGGSGSAPGVPGGTGTVTYRGSEMGNALSTTFGASSGQVGRNIYVPIYLFMPLPSKVDDAIYRNVQAKETFKAYYKQSGSQWILKSQVPLPQRGEFWTMIEAAGYDASNADFKTERHLAPVVLEFTVGPLNRSRVELVDVRIASSSGSAEVDEAVVYGFKQATFFNKTGVAIGGRFSYEF